MIDDLAKYLQMDPGIMIMNIWQVAKNMINKPKIFYIIFSLSKSNLFSH